MRPRVIPVLLIHEGGLVKTVRFRSPTYLGDPINTMRLFNDMEVDELIVLDISATRSRRPPDLEMIRTFADECFMPLCYGGGVDSIADARRLFELGVEKIAVNAAARRNPAFVRALSEVFGAQSIVVSVDVRKTLFGRYEIHDYCSGKSDADPFAFVEDVIGQGAGEILLNAVDRDGLMTGYDLALISQVSRIAKVPLIACGGAAKLTDCVHAIGAGADAAAAGSMFVFQGKERGVLINYPTQDQLHAAFQQASQEHP